MESYSKQKYKKKVEEIFKRFPSVQKVPFGEAYKPGMEHIERFCSGLGDPQRKYRTIHVAGTNGKGSVANMLAAVLVSSGLKVGLYTSPHIVDFRERMRIGSELVSEEYVWDFLCRHEEEMDRLDLSFFEITTGMAFKWFADMEVDVAVIETGLGGRLDSTNVIVPDLSV
ncbi:MAG: bifunctional folylpolyglutamate synthase/dihydrofolate synthase, partial [Candidatus Cryptobacteroides sp.]|nr:bifunctional folylpolyglutamate synthase/dihydrofolate synthase [Candidatus Cryptobacteroides sp.]